MNRERRTQVIDHFTMSVDATVSRIIKHDVCLDAATNLLTPTTLEVHLLKHSRHRRLRDLDLGNRRMRKSKDSVSGLVADIRGQ